MANWTKPVNFDEVFIIRKGKSESEDKSANLTNGLTSFNYYESIFSPVITSSLTFIDSGYTYYVENEGDTQQRSGTVQSSLPIKGGESVKLIVKHPTGTLDFDDYPFVVDFIGKGKAESKQQISSLHMVSEFGFINETTSVKHQVRNNITNSVRLILKDDLKVPDSKIRTEKTQNEAAFAGGGSTPFELILHVAPESKPIKGSAGYFFYETYQGFNFRSIDSLVRQAPIDHYTTDQDLSSAGRHANCRILDYYVVQNEDELTKLRSGVYKSRLIGFDAAKQEYCENEYDITNLSDVWNIDMATLGSNSFSEELNLKYSFADPSNFTYESDSEQSLFFPSSMIGIEQFSKDSDTQKVSNDAKQHRVISKMRYISLLTQVMNIVVPANLKLHAGGTVELDFIKLSGGNLNEGVDDERLSGKYLIINLAHKFTREANNASTTHMTVVRDTYGKYIPEVEDETSTVTES